MRRLPFAVAIASAVALASGCTSDGVKTQSVGPASSSSDRPSSSSMLATSTPTTPSSSPSTSWTPPPYGTAKPAVDAFLALDRAGVAAFRDPSEATTTRIDSYSDGQARAAYHQSLTAAKKQGIAYRGMPAQHRLTVVSSELDASLPKMVLRDCAMISPTDPWTAYSTSTGKPVETPTPKVAPPYANTITLFKPADRWLVFTIKTDATKTCTP